MLTSAQRFLSIPEAGRRLGKSPQTIKRLIKAGRLEAIQIPGTHGRVPLAAVNSFIPAQLRIADGEKTEPVRLAEPVPA